MRTVGGGRRVLMGALWSYGAQLITIVLQISYAAVVSRLANAHEFGVYSVALSTTGLISLIANGGMSQAISRLESVQDKVVGSLMTFSLIFGSIVAAFTFCTAEVWASLWGVSEAAVTIRWLCFGAAIAPVFSLETGFARRTGRFLHLATATVICNALGMVTGVVAVTTWASASSLTVSALAAQFFLLAYMTIAYRSFLRPRSLSYALPHVAFSSKLILAGILQYAVGNVGKLSATRVFGAPVIGQWNRAEVMTTVPMQQAQTAMVQAVYPEFRHDNRDSRRARELWPNMLLLIGWVSAPAGIVLAVFVPLLIPVVMGSQWQLAAEFSVPLAVGVAIQPMSILLASALESLGSFRRIWLTDLLLLFLQVLLVVWMVISADVFVIIWGIGLSNAVRLVVHSLIAARIGYFDMRTFLLGLSQLLVGCLITLAVSLVFKVAILGLAGTAGGLPAWITIFGLLLALAVSILLFWKRLPPIRLAFRYGIVKMQ